MVAAASEGRFNVVRALLQAGGQSDWSICYKLLLFLTFHQLPLTLLSARGQASFFLSSVLSSFLCLTALMGASAGNHVPVIDLLVKADVSLERTTSEGDSALHWTARLGKVAFCDGCFIILFFCFLF